MSMRVLLINPNIVQPPVVPLGLLSLAAAIREQHHDVHFLDLCFTSSRAFEKRIRAAIHACHPDVIGIGIRNLDNGTGYTAFDYVALYDKTVSLCQEHSTAKVVLGGPGFSILPRRFIARYSHCIGVVGEGESSFVSLLGALEAGKDLSNVPGLIWSQEGEVHYTGRRETADLSSLPPPALDLIDVGSYVKRGGGLSLQTKRGCPFACIFCSYPLIEGHCIRLKRPQKVVSEFMRLRELGASYIHIVDSVFNWPESHAIAICQALRKAGLDDVGWDAYFTPASFGTNLARSLKDANCQGVIFGTDSGDPSMLRRYGKPFGQKEIKTATENCHRYCLDFAHHILLGGPGESRESVLNTLAFMKSLQSRVLLDVGLQVYDGTELGKIVGVSETDPSALVPPLYVSPSVSGWVDREITALSRKEPSFRTYVGGCSIDPYTNHRVVDAYKQGRTGPYWRILDTLEKVPLRPARVG